MAVQTGYKVIVISAAAAILIVILGFMSGDGGILANLFILAVSVVIIPFFLYKYAHTLWIKGLEAQFPNFIRDLADSKRSGMSFPQAIYLAKKGSYGKLSSEIEKMHNRLTWGTPFLRVMEIFGDRVKDSKIISESLTIIKESYRAGGNIAGTLDSVARDIILLKEVEADRVSLVKQQVFIMYGIFYMFVGISVMIIFVMVPLLQSDQMPASTSGDPFGFQFSNPCENPIPFPCGLFSIIGDVLEVPAAAGNGLAVYYTALFFSVVVIQGIFTGLIAGQIGEGSIVSGTKHSLIMTFSAIGVFLFIAKAGLFPF